MVVVVLSSPEIAVTAELMHVSPLYSAGYTCWVGGGRWGRWGRSSPLIVDLGIDIGQSQSTLEGAHHSKLDHF